MAADSPAEHARISHYERNYIESSIAAPPGKKRKVRGEWSEGGEWVDTGRVNRAVGRVNRGRGICMYVSMHRLNLPAFD